MRVSKPPKERKAELVAAARRLFDEHGIDKTRVCDIVKEVGVAQGVFYYYFTSKDEIIAEVIAQVGAEVEAGATAILEDQSAPFCAKLAALIELYIDLVDQFLGDAETDLSSWDLFSPEKNKLADYGSELLCEKLVELVKQGAEQGEVPARYPEETVLVVLHGLRAFAARRLPTRKLIYTLTEQALCLPKGCLVLYSSKNAGAK